MRRAVAAIVAWTIVAAAIPAASDPWAPVRPGPATGTVVMGLERLRAIQRTCSAHEYAAATTTAAMMVCEVELSAMQRQLALRDAVMPVACPEPSLWEKHGFWIGLTAGLVLASGGAALIAVYAPR